MNNTIEVQELGGGVLYIEDAFPLHKEFIEAVEAARNSVIPKWDFWSDGVPIKIKDEESGSEEWVWEIDEEYSHRGYVKMFDWDRSINEGNRFWPRKEVDSTYSLDHEQSAHIVDMIDKPFKDMLAIWQEKTGNSSLDYISKNYCLRKYRIGGQMDVHVDRNFEDPRTSMDWTALIYLNDNYEGGEIVFPGLDISLKPKAGSIVFLPCNAAHKVNKITKGSKYYIFMFMHTEYGICTALSEPYNDMTEAISKIKAGQ